MDWKYPLQNGSHFDSVRNQLLKIQHGHQWSNLYCSMPSVCNRTVIGISFVDIRIVGIQLWIGLCILFKIPTNTKCLSCYLSRLIIIYDPPWSSNWLLRCIKGNVPVHRPDRDARGGWYANTWAPSAMTTARGIAGRTTYQRVAQMNWRYYHYWYLFS